MACIESNVKHFFLPLQNRIYARKKTAVAARVAGQGELQKNIVSYVSVLHTTGHLRNFCRIACMGLHDSLNNARLLASSSAVTIAVAAVAATAHAAAAAAVAAAAPARAGLRLRLRLRPWRRRRLRLG